MTSGEGQAGEESEMATYTGEGLGRLGSSGSTKWRGSYFFRMSPSGGGGGASNLIHYLV